MIGDGEGGWIRWRTASGAQRWLAVVSAELRAAVDRVIPADDWPGGWEGGVGDASGGESRRAAVGPGGMERLVDELQRRGFVAADPDDQDRILAEISEHADARADDVAALLRLCWEGFYATRAQRGRPRPRRRRGRPG